MDLLVAVLIVLVVGAVGWFVTVPLRRAPDEFPIDAAAEARVAALEARKEAKYREIRDTQLDHAQGKLSYADFARIDHELRREAIQILKELDAARGRAGAV